MAWIVFIFFILPAIFILSRVFDTGHGGVVIVPIFAAIAIGALYFLIRRTTDTGQPARSIIRIGCLLGFIYLGHNVYIGTLPAYDLAPPGRNQITEGDAISANAALLGWGGLIAVLAAIYFVARRDMQASEDKFIAAAIRQVGRAPDTSLFSRNDREYLRFMMWVPERQLYLADANLSFDPLLIRSFDDVRDWNIEKSQKRSGDKVWDAYTVNVGLKDTAKPLFAFFCGKNKEAAYQIAEGFNQMAEERVGAARVTIG